MTNKQENSSGNRNLVYIIIGVVVVIVLGLLLYYFLGTGSPDSDVADTGARTGGGAAVADSPAADSAAADSPAADSAGETSGATVEVEALSNINQRGGPGTDYGVVGSLPQGGTAIAVGRNADGSWILVQTESGDEVWMTASTDLVKANGDLMSLPVVSAAAPAYDAGNPMVNKVMNEIPLVVHHADTFTCASHGGLNSLLPEVASGNVVGPHSGDFIYNGNNVLFKKANGSVVLINENPVARFEGDAESLSLARAMQLFANGEIIWNGTSGDWPARGVTGCDLLVRQ